MNPAVTWAIAAIAEHAWAAIKYPRAVFDEQEQRWVCDAQVAQIDCTAFTSYPKDQQIPCRLVVRRVQRLNKAAARGQGELFDTWRHHAFVANSTDRRTVLASLGRLLTRISGAGLVRN